MTITEKRVTARDGISLFLRDYAPTANGAMLPVLCLSGVTRTSRDFDRLARHLTANGRRVLALDYRGRGGSDRAKDPMTYTPQTYLDDIRACLTALNLHRVHLIGTSLGGFLAMAVAIAMPTAVAGAILNDSGPDLPAHGLGRIVDHIADRTVHADWDSAIAATKAALPDLNLTEDDWRRAAEGNYRAAPDGRIHPDWDPAIAIPLRKAGGLDLWGLFGALRDRPVLALRGELSKLLSDACFARMAERHPGLRRATIPNRGHAPTLDEPESRTAIDAFLAALP
ncbi:alpha/beta hydrolase [Rhodospirillaceae bacterium KN72]|uniref:Alpha/beta hydrolase n=1 Tax=Pacificispira spongiicola TaxID=2729598 RepID=A0A7Y0E0G0_9PROT|nr:alpha/beta fold hydrolase [Pacificispira spongiicola]NMM44191.1 alpha/beta hydrolase [Pacificispira spongiicola]